MRRFKNWFLAGNVVLVLFGSSILGVSRAIRGSESKSFKPTRPTSLAQKFPIDTRLAAGANLKRSSASLADSPEGPDDLSIDASQGDDQIALKRKHRRSGGGTLVVIQIIAVLVSSRTVDGGGPQMIDLQATITGPDAVQGSLLFGLAWLAGDPDPLRAVRALGYEIEVSKEHDRPCPGGPANKVCVDRARWVATLLDATLALGSPDERALFRQGAAALGVAPDCSGVTTTGPPPVVQTASLDTPAADLLIDA